MYFSRNSSTIPLRETFLDFSFDSSHKFILKFIHKCFLEVAALIVSDIFKEMLQEIFTDMFPFVSPGILIHISQKIRLENPP